MTGHHRDTRHRAIIDALPADIALLDGQGVIVSVNRTWRQFADANAMQDPARGVGSNYLHICDRAEGEDSSEAGPAAAGIRSVLDGTLGSFSLEYPCHSPGERRWFLLTVTPLGDGDPTGAVVMHLDITARKRSELALGELSHTTGQRERMLSTMLSSIKDFTYIFDREGRLLFANQPLLDFWGIPLDAAVGRTFAGLGFPAELAARLHGQVREVFETGQIITGETPFRGLAGATGFHEYILAPVIGADRSVEFVVGSTRDVTERKRYEASLQESEGRYRALADWSSESIVVSQGGSMVFVNPSALAMFGAAAEHQLIGRPLLDHVHPDSLPVARERAESNSRYGGSLPMIEKKFIRLDGTVINVEIQGQSITYNGAAAFVHSLRDITTRKRTEDALRASIENFHQLADNIADVFWIRSADMRELHYVSPAFEKVWGRTVASLHNNPHEWSDFVVDEDRQRVLAAFSGLTRDTPTIDVEYRITRPDGEIRWVRSRGVQVRDSEGRLNRNIGIVTDTTDRKRSEMAVRQSQERLRGIIDGMGPSMFVGLLTLEGILIEVNRAPLEGAGLTAGDVLGKHFADAPWWTYSADAQLQLRAAIARAAGGESSRYDVRAQMGQGNLIDIDFAIEPLRDDSGKVVFLIPSASVITERKVAEDALRQAQKMEAVGQLAAGVAHEFNNLMQALMSMSAIIRLRTDPSEITRIGTEMEFLLKRGAGLTRQLLLFSRDTPIEKVDLDVGEEVRKASVLLGHLMPETIRIVVEVSPDPLMIAGDNGQIQQVLLNLAINARDAMAAGGTLTLRAGRNGDEVFQEVEDTGQGIEADTHRHLFEPFFTTKEQGKGTGLGLAVAHGIVERHDGRFEVTSTPGRGSCFRVIFPALMREAERPQGTVAGQNVPSGGGRLLLVEDDPSVREGLEALLEMIGYEVIAAGSAEEAMALTVDPPPALLLSDITLPGMTGPEMVGHLRARWPELKVVLMSGYLDESMQVNARRDQWRFLQKPFEFDDLEREVSEAMNDGPAMAMTG